MANIGSSKVKDTYQGLLHVSGGQLTLANGSTGAFSYNGPLTITSTFTTSEANISNFTNPSLTRSGLSLGTAALSSESFLLNRVNHTSTQSADTITDGTTNKAFLATERTKLSGIASGATANSTDAYLRDRLNHTGTQSADTITASATKDTFLLTERTKLSGIATGATSNSTDAFLRDRLNHTGVQAISTITNLQTTLDAKIDAVASSPSIPAIDSFNATTSNAGELMDAVGALITRLKTRNLI